MRELEIRTVSQILTNNITSEPTRIELFDFGLEKKKINLSSNSEQYVGSNAATWIRVFDSENRYFDFITSSIFYISNKKGVVLFCAEDAEYISFKYISKLIEEFMAKINKDNAIDVKKYMMSYTKALSKELKEADQNLTNMYSANAQTSNKRLALEDSLTYAKDKLARKYLLGYIAKKLIKENREEILQILKSK